MLMPTSPARDKGCEGHLSGILNPGTQAMFAVSVSRFKAGKCSSGINLGRHQAAEQGHEWHEQKLSWRPKKV